MQLLRKLAGDVVVVGAGVAGCSAFYHLAKLNKHNPAFKPILVDALPPLSLTSANGSFSYRNWFPSDQEAPMRELVVRSIDELDEISRATNNAIELNRNGYLFVTRDATKVDEFKRMGAQLQKHGGGSLRVHAEHQNLADYQFPPETIEYDLDGCDLLLGMENIARVFPSLGNSKAIAALHVRRCGSMNPFKLGNYELTKAVDYSPHAQILRGKVTDIFAVGGRVSGLKLQSDDGEMHISTPNVVFATGPLYQETMGLLKKKNLSNFDIPIFNELHARATFDDPAGIITSTTPLTFDSDPIGTLEFTESERKQLATDPSAARMLEPFPSGVHVRPYTQSKMMAVWTYETENVAPLYPVEKYLDQNYPEICLRGLSKLFPQMKSYLSDPAVRSTFKVNGGYYCKTLDNMPLIGPAPNTVDGVYLQSAMSGVGLMSSGASGQLLAAHVMKKNLTGDSLQKHVDAFLPSRFENKEYVTSLAGGSSRLGQV